MKTIKDVMENSLAHVKITPKLIKEIKTCANEFMNKNADHIQFFGGNLTGVQTVRFTTKDRNKWVIDILDMDDRLTHDSIKQLDSVDPNWHRGTDAMNISCLYIVYLIGISNLSTKQKRQAQIDTLMILQYKFISSILAHNYKYPANPELAQATYDALSGKFAIKKYKTWYNVLLNRAEDIIREDALHHSVIEKFETDQDIQNMITDIQGRLRRMIVNINKVFYELSEQNTVIASQSGLVALPDGGLKVRDLIRDQDKYIRYLKQSSLTKNDFIKRELITVVAGAMKNLPQVALYDMLVRISELSVERDTEVEKLLQEVLIHAFSHLSKRRNVGSVLRTLPSLTLELKSLYMASRSNNESVLFMRSYLEKLITKETKIKTKSTVSSIRTGILMYLILRAFTMQYYS